MRDRIIALAKENEADLVGFAPASRFAPNDPIFTLMPEVKTVIGPGLRVLRGCYRGIEEGTCFYQYTTMGVENMEETVMPMSLLRVSALLEEEGYLALPQRRHQQIMPEDGGVNPEVYYIHTYRGITAECQMNFEDTAVKCGLGERGLHGSILCDEFGPFLRYVFILTDAELEATPMYEPHLCDGCGECAKNCPGHALAKDENNLPVLDYFNENVVTAFEKIYALYRESSGTYIAEESFWHVDNLFAKGNSVFCRSPH